MSRRFKRWASIAMLAFLSFAQASLAASGCLMQRGQMGPLPASSVSIGGCHMAASFVYQGIPMPAGGCLAHCSQDLQTVGQPLLDAIPAPQLIPLHIPRIDSFAGTRVPCEAPPPRTVPARILLHSFLI